MCDPILVNLLKIWPHYSQSSRENATPSSGTSSLASYREVPLTVGVAVVGADELMSVRLNEIMDQKAL